MVIGRGVIGPEGAHTAGRQLLFKLYQAHYGGPMPQISLMRRGKPYFENSPVHFSISHTPRHVFCVLSDRPVGIDAEEQDRQVKDNLAERILSDAEYARYGQAADKHAALLRLWVLKEAAAKLTGEGLRGFPNTTDFDPDDSRIRIMDGCFVAVIEGEI